MFGVDEVILPVDSDAASIRYQQSGIFRSSLYGQEEQMSTIVAWYDRYRTVLVFAYVVDVRMPSMI